MRVFKVQVCKDSVVTNRNKHRGSLNLSVFSPEEYQMVKKHLWKISTSLVFREMQIKTTLKFCLIPIRLAKVKNSDNSRCW